MRFYLLMRLSQFFNFTSKTRTELQSITTSSSPPNRLIILLAIFPNIHPQGIRVVFSQNTNVPTNNVAKYAPIVISLISYHQPQSPTYSPFPYFISSVILPSASLVTKSSRSTISLGQSTYLQTSTQAVKQLAHTNGGQNECVRR